MKHQHIRELVHHQAGQEIRLGIDQAAAHGVAEQLPVFPGVPDAAGEELPVAGLVLPGQYAQGNLALGVVEAPADELAPEVVHIHDVAVFKRAVHLLDLRGVDPGMSPAHTGLAGLAKRYGRHDEHLTVFDENSLT